VVGQPVTIVPERDLYVMLEKGLKLLRVRYYHTHDSRRSVAGYPDFTIFPGWLMLMAEVKRDGGYLTVEQAEWLAAGAGITGCLAFAVAGPDGVVELVELVGQAKAGRQPKAPGSVYVIGDVRLSRVPPELRPLFVAGAVAGGRASTA
jgi:hypothetical protein